MKWTHTAKLLLVLALNTICSSTGFGSDMPKPSEKPYGLRVGEIAPRFAVQDIHGEKFGVEQKLAKGPVVLVFYRGGWCPYCNTQLRSIESKLMPGVKNAKGSLVAISVDKPDEELKTKQKNSLSFQIVSDPKAELLGKYNVRYKVPEELVATYKTKHGINLEASSGEKHHIIAVPAVYVVSQDGKIAYSFVDEDYKKRAPEEAVLAALTSKNQVQK